MEDEAKMKVLVAYASRHGATAEIAGRIGDVLGSAGLAVDVLPVDRVRDLAPYRAVVLGSAVYIGLWRKGAAAFLKQNEQRLAGLPVWLFSSGPMGQGDPLTLTEGWRLPTALRPIVERIRPRDIAVFGGVADLRKLNLFEKWIMKKVQAPSGDFRDWNAITAWAAAIGSALTEGVAEAQ